LNARKILCLFLDASYSCDDESLRVLTANAARTFGIRMPDLQSSDPWLSALCSFAGCGPDSDSFTAGLVNLMLRWHGRDGAARIALSFAIESLK
jgi:hypothetical protein